MIKYEDATDVGDEDVKYPIVEDIDDLTQRFEHGGRGWNNHSDEECWYSCRYRQRKSMLSSSRSTSSSEVAGFKLEVISPIINIRRRSAVHCISC